MYSVLNDDLLLTFLKVFLELLSNCFLIITIVNY